MSSDGSVSLWLDQLKTGDPEAAQKLWDLYFRRLAGLARHKLAGMPCIAATEEDVALSAFASFCRGVERDRFPHLLDRDNLWRVLVVITARKASHLVRRQLQLRRRGELPQAGENGRPRLEEIVSREPTPEFAAEVADECRRLLGRLGDADLEAVALWRMEGYTTGEIAAKLGCAPRSVERKLRLIRDIWEEETSNA